MSNGGAAGQGELASATPAAEGATDADAKETWTLRLRGPKGTPATLELPDGADTLLGKLIELAGKATRVAGKKLVIRAGFPPKELLCEGKKDHRTVVQLGLSNRDVLHIDRRAAPSDGASKLGDSAAGIQPETPAAETGRDATGSSPNPPATAQSTPYSGSTATLIPDRTGSGSALRSSGAAAGTPVTPATVQSGPQNKRKGSAGPKRRRMKIPGVGRRLGDGTEPEEKGDAVTESPGAESSLGTCKSASEAAEHAIASDLVTAASKGGGTVSSVHKALRRSLKEARAERGAEADARLKVAAALSGKVSFRPLQDGTGRVEVQYSAGPRGAVKREVVTDIPPVLLPAILNLVASDNDPVSRSNMRVEAMSLVSPRMFWAVVRHGGVGPQKSLHEALSTLTPQIDWAAIEQRNRHTPERYADYVAH